MANRRRNAAARPDLALAYNPMLPPGRNANQNHHHNHPNQNQNQNPQHLLPPPNANPNPNRNGRSECSTQEIFLCCSALVGFIIYGIAWIQSVADNPYIHDFSVAALSATKEVNGGWNVTFNMTNLSNDSVVEYFKSEIWVIRNVTPVSYMRVPSMVQHIHENRLVHASNYSFKHTNKKFMEDIWSAKEPGVIRAGFSATAVEYNLKKATKVIYTVHVYCENMELDVATEEKGPAVSKVPGRCRSVQYGPYIRNEGYDLVGDFVKLFRQHEADWLA